MAIIKCKMCGGDIVLNEEKTFGTCEYCGSTMTLPKVSDEQRAARFNRGNHFRRQGEFDKALAVYESIVREDDADAEAHWCCALCRFGIEYVEDPNTYEYLPTCHRASFDSFLEDVDYLAALEHSDGITKRQYQKDAAKIAEVQRGILATSQNEEPYDVFICYKETDDGTKERTRDSIDAQEIYYQLTQAGYRTFFSRITLEDKAGTEYEPYIFAALNSAKVMVAIGSKPEYFNAVWVKNEWSRFLAMMRKDRSKLLLPCYKGMDPYDLPEQLGVLQSYDMGKIGFMQDLIRGIKKVLERDEPKPAAPQPVVQYGGPSTANLLRRGDIFLEEKNWSSAEEYFNKVLDIEAENGNAYLGLALAKAQCPNLDAFAQKLSMMYTSERSEDRTACGAEMKRIEDLAAKLAVPGYYEEKEIRESFKFDRTYPSREESAKENKARALAALNADRNYSRAKQYADDSLREKLSETERKIEAAYDRRIEKAKADAASAKAAKEKRYREHLIQQEKAAEEKRRHAAQCKKNDRLAACKKQENDYLAACRIQEEANTESGVVKAGEMFEKAAVMFEKEGLHGFRDSAARAEQCRTEIARLKAEEIQQNQKEEAEELKRRKKKKKIGIISAALAALALAAFLVVTKVIIPTNRYKAAEALLSEGKNKEAAAAFASAGGFKDSRERCVELWGDMTQRETLSAGGDHTVGLKSDGTVVVTGYNFYGQWSVSDWKEIVAVSAGHYHTVGLKADGTVVATGDNDDGQCKVSGWKHIVAVSTGDSHTVGLKADGTVVATGRNDDSQCNVSDWKDIVAVSTGYSHTVGLKADGTVVATGGNDDGQCDVSDWDDIVTVSAGLNHTVGLKADGTVVATGRNDDGRCNVSGWTDIVAVSAGSKHTVGLKADGTVVARGYDVYGQCSVSGWTDIVAVSAGSKHTVGLKADGTVVASGSNSDSECDVSGWTGIKIGKKKAEADSFNAGKHNVEIVGSEAQDGPIDAPTYYADITVENYGTITVALDAEAAPKTAANFVDLAQSGFYDGLTFHRIIDGFLIQGGDPTGTGTGGSDHIIEGEFSANGFDNSLSHTRGAISMARANDYDSASSQFFIVQSDSTFLDGSYACFGYVTAGMEYVDQICANANPIDDNGSIIDSEQPVIKSISIRTE